MPKQNKRIIFCQTSERSERGTQGLFWGLIPFILILSIFLLSSVPVLAGEYEVEGGGKNYFAGFVPCGYDLNGDGTMDINERCQLCHFFVMFDNIIAFIYSKIVPILAVFVFVLAGVLLFTSGADPKMPGKVKKMIFYAVLGLVLIYSCWILVGAFLNVLGVTEWRDPYGTGWFKIQCPISPTFVGGKNPFEGKGGDIIFDLDKKGGDVGPPPEPDFDDEEDTSGQPPTQPQSCGANLDLTSDQSVFNCLKEQSKGHIKRKNDCGQEPPRTCFNGLRLTTIQGIVLLFNECSENAGHSCEIMITGGTEPGHTAGTYSHSNGYKLDLRSTNKDVNKAIYNRIGTNNPALDQNYCRDCDRCSKCSKKIRNDGNIYRYEIDHWDICFQCYQPR